MTFIKSEGEEGRGGRVPSEFRVSMAVERETFGRCLNSEVLVVMDLERFPGGRRLNRGVGWVGGVLDHLTGTCNISRGVNRESREGT